MENNTKIIHLDLNISHKKPKKEKEKPPPKKRIITETTKWHDYLDENLDVEPQWSMLIALSKEYNIPIDTIDISYNSLDIPPEKISFLKNEIQLREDEISYWGMKYDSLVVNDVKE